MLLLPELSCRSIWPLPVSPTPIFICYGIREADVVAAGVGKARFVAAEVREADVSCRRCQSGCRHGRQPDVAAQVRQADIEDPVLAMPMLLPPMLTPPVRSPGADAGWVAGDNRADVDALPRVPGTR